MGWRHQDGAARASSNRHKVSRSFSGRTLQRGRILADTGSKNLVRSKRLSMDGQEWRCPGRSQVTHSEGCYKLHARRCSEDSLNSVSMDLRVPLYPQVSLDPGQHESSRHGWDQRGREPLRDSGAGTGVKAAVVDPRARRRRADAERRGTLQSAPKAFDAQPRHFTGSGARMLQGRNAA